MDELTKGQITRQLQAVHNEINLGWSEQKVSSLVSDDTFEAKFDHFLWGEGAKIRTTVIMQKIKVKVDEPGKGV